jgi:hypothetical protein
VNRYVSGEHSEDAAARLDYEATMAWVGAQLKLPPVARVVAQAHYCPTPTKGAEYGTRKALCGAWCSREPDVAGERGASARHHVTCRLCIEMAPVLP